MSKQKKPRSLAVLEKQMEGGTFSTSKDPNAFSIIIEGEEMAPRIIPGDRVVFEPNTPIEDGDIAIVKMNDRRTYLRRYFRCGSVVHLRAENPSAEHLKVSHSDIAFAYPAFETVRPEQLRPKPKRKEPPMKSTAKLNPKDSIQG